MKNKELKSLLMINSSLTNGGAEHVMVMLANELHKRGYEIDMLIGDESAPETYKLDDGIKKIKYHSNGKNGMLYVINWMRLIRKYQKRKEYTAVISFMMAQNDITLMAGFGLKQKIIVSERANPLLVSEYGKIYKIGEQLLYPTAHRVVFQTDEVKGYYKRSIQKKGVVIPNPVDPSITGQWKMPSEKVIVSVGRLTKQKNYPMLIRAFKRFRDEIPGYKLVIYGRGPLLEELKNLSKQLEICNDIEFAGFSENVDVHIKTASMFVLSSDFEGISNTMIESLAMGVPTICTDCPVGGARMLIKSGENGILVPVGDEHALADAMISIAKNPKYAIKMGEEAIKIRQEYDIEKIVDKWEKIILS